MAVYPMEAPNRRKERREDVIAFVESQTGVEIKDVVDYTSAEEDEVYLEGTGSVVLDRVHKIYSLNNFKICKWMIIYGVSVM